MCDVMAMVMVALAMMPVVVLAADAVAAAAAATTLRADFYAKSCPRLSAIVKAEVKKASMAEPRMAASLTRLHFHDCFVNGCDGSLLLDNSSTFDSEKYSLPNIDSLRGFEVVDTIKAAVEAACPQTVSCADILAVASLHSSVQFGGTEYEVLFGRRDSLTANLSASDEYLPSPQFNYTQLVANFARVGLNEHDLVTLSGAHTFGRARCMVIHSHLTDKDINPSFAATLKLACPNSSFDLVPQNLDFSTPNKFDNNYFKQLRKNEGVLRSDQVLHSTPGINVDIVKEYAQNKKSFFKQYGIASIKMGNIKPLTGTQGEVRLNCRLPNSIASQVLVASQ